MTPRDWGFLLALVSGKTVEQLLRGLMVSESLTIFYFIYFNVKGVCIMRIGDFSTVQGLQLYRQLETNVTSYQESIRRLSTGKEIEKASDSPVMINRISQTEAQIRERQVIQKDLQDGIAFTQTVDDAVSQMERMSQRLREISVQLSNDTINRDEQDALLKEGIVLLGNINDVLNETKFNDKKVFKQDKFTLSECSAGRITIDLSYLKGFDKAVGKLVDKLRGEQSKINELNKAGAGQQIGSIENKITLSINGKIRVKGQITLTTFPLSAREKISLKGKVSLKTSNGKTGANLSREDAVSSVTEVITRRSSTTNNDKLSNSSTNGGDITATNPNTTSSLHDKKHKRIVYAKGKYKDKMIGKDKANRDKETVGALDTSAKGKSNIFIPRIHSSSKQPKENPLAEQSSTMSTENGLQQSEAQQQFVEKLNNERKKVSGISEPTSQEKIAPKEAISEIVKTEESSGLNNISPSLFNVDYIDEFLLKPIAKQRTELGIKTQLLERKIDFNHNMKIRETEDLSRITDVDIAKETANMVKQKLLMEINAYLIHQFQQNARDLVRALLFE